MQEKKLDIINENTVLLCCGGKCPKVTRNELSKEFIIQDDYGNFILLSSDHFSMLVEAVTYFQQ